jgi:predicted histone-like DNA-binding protein
MLKYSLIERANPFTEEVCYYASLNPPTPITLESFAANICGNCNITTLQLYNVIYHLENEIIKALQNGNSVRLGDLGSFHITLSSTGTDTPDKFSKENLRGLKVRFVPTSKMRKEFDLNNPKVALLRKEG